MSDEERRAAARAAANEKIRLEQLPKEQADAKAWEKVGKQVDALRQSIAALSGSAKSQRVRAMTAKLGLGVAALADLADQPAVTPPPAD